ncbi:MAG: DinB family protein [Ignavibacteria bacterium]|nr:DinB family protein [Ignavibacteria bacterium]MBT8381313.1 DinB family protein [Ignavibacteria bacterium]MBT8391288.1 DinB family protein [Ignavibacteria bacterium]
MRKDFRKGAIGALMDVYERASNELKKLIVQISKSDFDIIVDSNTEDEDCRSVQTILSHVIYSGYGYADYIRDWFQTSKNSPERRTYSQDEINNELDKMLTYTAETLDGKWELSTTELMKIKIKSRYGPEYDIEQLLEHAIVHILRHHRQIEKFISTSKIKSQSKTHL